MVEWRVNLRFDDHFESSWGKWLSPKSICIVIYLDMLAYSPFHHVTRLLAPEYFSQLCFFYFSLNVEQSSNTEWLQWCTLLCSCGVGWFSVAKRVLMLMLFLCCVMCTKIPINIRQVQYLYIRNLMVVVCSSTCRGIMRLYMVVLTLRRRIKSHLLFAGIIRSSPFSPRWQDKG